MHGLRCPSTSSPPLLNPLHLQVDKDSEGQLNCEEFVQLLQKAKGKLSEIVSSLRMNYLDDKAIAAGAADVVWYTDEMILKRETLKKDRTIKDAITQVGYLGVVPSFWIACFYPLHSHP